MRARFATMVATAIALVACGGTGEDVLEVAITLSPVSFDAAGNPRLSLQPVSGGSTRYQQELLAAGVEASNRFCARVVLRTPDGQAFLTPGSSPTFIAVFTVPARHFKALEAVGYQSYAADYKPYVTETFTCESRNY
jgi:hypothetical protein